MATFPNNLHVITCVSNPMRWRSRAELCDNFQKMCAQAGVTLWTIEAAFGERPHAHTTKEDPHHIQVRIKDEMWHKETLLNYAISRLPEDAKYVAWVDADLTFTNPNWASETVHQLQHYRVVQMFSEAHNLAPDGTTVSGSRCRSFGWSHVHGIPRRSPNNDGRYGDDGRGDDPSIHFYQHPGFAWAIRRECLDLLGGLYDMAVVGEADYIMAKAIVGEVDHIVYPGVTDAYRHSYKVWEDRAKVLRRDLGYVPGTIIHHWHGRRVDRGYWNRLRILKDAQFNPYTDLKRNSQGIWELHDDGSDRFITLRDGLRSYFRSRNEDSVDL